MKQLSMDAKVLEKFDALLGRLSPENLCCDGELSQAETDASYRQIMREWAALEKKVGRKVSEDEVHKNLARSR